MCAIRSEGGAADVPEDDANGGSLLVFPEDSPGLFRLRRRPMLLNGVFQVWNPGDGKVLPVLFYPVQL